MELWDVLDEHGNKTGKVINSGAAMERGEYRRLIDVWIINEGNEFLISKRTSVKQPYPNMWNPVCGSVVAGEDSISAALRETKEELGIILNPKNGRLVKSSKCWETAIVDVWLFHQEVNINTVVLQKEETDDIMWATSDLLKQMINNDEFIHHERIPYTNELFLLCGGS
jgi:isopentenyldiphosphate isomerase